MTSSAENDEENPKAVDLPPKPKEPSQEDCCGNGCNPCVFDLYEQECKIWRKQCLAVTHPQGLHEKVLTVVLPRTDYVFWKFLRESSIPCLAFKIGNVAPMSGAYTPFTVSRIQQLTWNSLIFTLQKKCNDQHISIEIGRHLLLRYVKSLNQFVPAFGHQILWTTDAVMATKWLPDSIRRYVWHSITLKLLLRWFNCKRDTSLAAD